MQEHPAYSLQHWSRWHWQVRLPFQDSRRRNNHLPFFEGTSCLFEDPRGFQYYADDSRSAENIDKHYKSALELYKNIEYELVHEYLAGRLKMWYKNHPQHRPQWLKSPPAEAAVGDAIDGDAPGFDGTPQKRLQFSMELVITVQAGAIAAAAVGEGAAQSSTATPATPAAGSPRAAAGAPPP